jgi:hypothetical protein
VTVPAICKGNGENRKTNMHIKQSCKSTLVNLNILLLTSHYSCCKITCGPNRVKTKTQLSPKSVFLLYMNLETTRLRGRTRNGWQDEVREDGRIVGGEE